MMLAFPWWAWAIVAVGVGLAELHVPGSYLIWIALGAAVTAAIDAVWGLSFPAQIGTFAVASALSCILGYFVYRKKFNRQERALNQPDVQMIGVRGVTCETFANGRGKVRLGDSVWLAEGPDLANGVPIVVTSLHGTAVVVAAAAAAKGAV